MRPFRPSPERPVSRSPSLPRPRHGYEVPVSIERTARRRGAFLLAAALSLASLVVVRPARAEIIDRVVAVLDEEAIFLSELEARARPFLAEINASAPAIKPNMTRGSPFYGRSFHSMIC